MKSRKKYILTESQYKELIESKKVAKKIIDEINSLKKGINESNILTGAIQDVIKKYHKKGHLSESVINELKKEKISVSFKKTLND